MNGFRVWGTQWQTPPLHGEVGCPKRPQTGKSRGVIWNFALRASAFKVVFTINSYSEANGATCSASMLTF